MSHSSEYLETLASLKNADIRCLTFNRGIEKEGLRVKSDSSISQAPHDPKLGSALTHPSITTDYSEALLEFITPVKDNAKDVLAYLQGAQQFAAQNIAEEMIWPASMPGVIENELDVPIATYGTSNLGVLKHVYRHGLWHRYGRKMQCIAGLHYNFSVNDALWEHLASLENKTVDKDFISAGYFGLIRNFRRYSWLLLYLFGASPALDKSFVKGKEHPLEEFDQDSLYLPYATSLRMSGLGYQNNAQEGLFVCFNGLPTYTHTLKDAMAKTMPQYEQLGVKVDGVYKQLNTHLLQIENEYYSDIRPKRNPKHGEKPLTALNEHGVEYIEVRCLDLNPFAPQGIDETQIHFMDLFLSFCVLQPSPKLSSAECAEVQQNSHEVVLSGRDPSFTLARQGTQIKLTDWALDLFESMALLAGQLDEQLEVVHYSQALAEMKKRVMDPSLTPSAKILETMQQEKLSYRQLMLKQAQQMRDIHLAPLSADESVYWQDLAEKSLEKQQIAESQDTVGFDEFLAQYHLKV